MLEMELVKIIVPHPAPPRLSCACLCPRGFVSLSLVRPVRAGVGVQGAIGGSCGHGAPTGCGLKGDMGLVATSQLEARNGVCWIRMSWGAFNMGSEALECSEKSL